MYYISIISIFKKAWGTVKANLLTYSVAIIILFAIQVIFSLVTNPDRGEEMIITLGLLNIGTALLSLLIGVMVTTALIRIGRGAPLTTQVLSITPSQVLRFVGVSIVEGLIMLVIVIPVVGFAFVLGVTSLSQVTETTIWLVIASALVAFLVIIYVSIRFMFAKYIVLDGPTGVIDALTWSWKCTSGQLWTIVKLGLLSFGVTILGICALLLGLLVALPVIAFAYVYLYIELAEKNGKTISSVNDNE